MINEEKSIETANLVEKVKAQCAPKNPEPAPAKDGIITTDLYGYINDVNDAILRLYGTTDKKEFINKNILKFAVKTDKERATNSALNMIISNQGRISEYHAITKSGEEIPLEVSTAILCDENGEKIGFRHTIRNLSVFSEKK